MPSNSKPIPLTSPEPVSDDPAEAVVELLHALRAELWTQERKRYPELEAEPEPEPIVPIAPAVVDAAAHRYDLPPVYRAFLQALGKSGISIVPGPFQELVLYAAPELDGGQVGFRGTKPGDATFVAPHGWRRTWIVIAYDNGDPYFIDTSKTTPAGEAPVWSAMQGTGTWEPHLAASSLAQFLRLLRVWAHYVVPHHDPQNPDEPLDDAQIRRLNAEITQIDADAADHWTL